MTHRPILFLVASGGSLVGGYKSGRNRKRGTRDADSIASTRSAGTRPSDIHPDTDPCDFSPSFRASSDCPPTASHAASNASCDGPFVCPDRLDLTEVRDVVRREVRGAMQPINARSVNIVNAPSANGVSHYVGVSRQAESKGSPFWQRLVEAWGAKGLPTSQYGVAKKLNMDGNGSTGRWFRGDGYPEMEKLIEIAKLGNVTVDWLLTERLPKHPIDPQTNLGYIHGHWSGLDEDSERDVVRTLEGRRAVLRLDDQTAKIERKQSR